MKITKKEIFAFCFNIIILLLTITGVVLISMSGDSAGEILKYYTTDSNLFVGIAAIISIIYMILKWNGNVKKIPYWVNIVKLIATATVALTMLITVFVLTASLAATGTNPSVLYTNSNMIFHIFTPTVAIVTFLLFEDSKDIKLIKTLYSLIPTLLYTIFYIVMVYTHIDASGKIASGYDWYGFASFGTVASIFITIGIVGLYYLLTWMLWFFNRKINDRLWN